MYGRMIDERAIKERYAALCVQLDERERRLYAAAEVRAIGYGGLAAVARATGLSRGTIGRGPEGSRPRPAAQWPGAEPGATHEIRLSEETTRLCYLPGSPENPKILR
jgi:hypothetical protein